MNDTPYHVVPDKVHLVGSIGLDTVEKVFHTTGSLLGRRLRREPGGRRLWISWQYPLLRAQPFLKADMSQPNPVSGFPPLHLADYVTDGDIRFPELGYAREARASYQDFLAAKAFGYLAPSVRFQVSLPTPFAVINPFCVTQDAITIEQAYENAMIREIGMIARAIPHEQLCIQWDVCLEMVMWDGRLSRMRGPFIDLPAEIMARMARIGSAVPEDVELGFHLCYGDWDGKHMIDPLDAGKLVEFANALTRAVLRPITYIHMPVPLDRSDDAYFQPLGSLRLSPGGELFLGLVHTDGADATRRRIAAAANHATGFGIATECGMARCNHQSWSGSSLRFTQTCQSNRRPTKLGKYPPAQACEKLEALDDAHSAHYLLGRNSPNRELGGDLPR